MKMFFISIDMSDDILCFITLNYDCVTSDMFN